MSCCTQEFARNAQPCLIWRLGLFQYQKFGFSGFGFTEFHSAISTVRATSDQPSNSCRFARAEWRFCSSSMMALLVLRFTGAFIVLRRRPPLVSTDASCKSLCCFCFQLEPPCNSSRLCMKSAGLCEVHWMCEVHWIYGYTFQFH